MLAREERRKGKGKDRKGKERKGKERVSMQRRQVGENPKPEATKM